jgi:hypothetical protein
MAEPLKIKVDFSDTAKAILHFITDTQEGKYTELKPDLSQITYKRIQIQGEDNSNPFNNEEEDNLLLGLSF